jgi:hypothetical protein
VGERDVTRPPFCPECGQPLNYAERIVCPQRTLEDCGIRNVPVETISQRGLEIERKEKAK